MTGREVAALLREISQLLQLKGENTFKVRAYDLAADAFEGLPPDPAAPGGLYERVKNGTLSELSGVGKAIDQKVTELVRTGSLRYLEELRREFPHGALDLVQIPGLGPRKAVALIHELDVTSLDDLEKAAGVAEILARGGTKCSVRMREGLQADLRVVTEAQFATALHHFTGSKQHHVKLRGIARSKGLSISEYGLARLEGGESLQPQTEEELYRTLGLAPVPPELREDLGEIELAATASLPELVSLADVRGFVHCHSTWSDGNATIEEMVRAAQARGAQYITITDHTRAAHYANGLG